MGKSKKPKSAKAGERTVVVVDDDASIRSTVRLILSRSRIWSVLAEYPTGSDAIRGIQKEPPHLVLLDICMPGMDGIQCTKLLRRQHPDLIIVIMTGCMQHELISEALNAGVSGYLVKPFSVTDLMESLDAALLGRLTLQAPAFATLRQLFSRASEQFHEPNVALTSRERGIIGLVEKGMTDRQIAINLGISECTVKTHLHRVYVKLGASCRAQVVAMLHQRPG